MGVQEARISISVSSLRGDSFPKDALETRVTVPLGALNTQSFRSSDSKTSSSQLLEVGDLLA